MAKRKVPRPDGGISMSIDSRTARTLSHAPQLLLLCPKTVTVTVTVTVRLRPPPSSQGG